MLGKEDPYAMLDRLDERVFQDWFLFWSEEPFGPMVENSMLARVANAAAMGDDEDSYLPVTVSGW